MHVNSSIHRRTRLIGIEFDMKPEVRLCASSLVDGPFTLGRALLRLADERRSPLQSKAELVRAFVDPSSSTTSVVRPMTLTVDEAFRTKFFATAQIGFLCHDLLDSLEPTLARIGLTICHSELADETDRQLLDVLMNRGGRTYAVTVLQPDETVPEKLYPEPFQREMVRLPTGLSGSALKRWHDRKAVDLSKASDAVEARIYHLVHGSDPGQAVSILTERIVDASKRGYYAAALRYGEQIFEIKGFSGEYDHDVQAILRAYVVALLGHRRVEEAIALYRRARDFWNNPRLHSGVHYIEAMTQARYNPKRDYDSAATSLDQAVQAAERIDDSRDRAYQLAFLDNAWAYLLMRTGDVEGALSRLDEALRRLDSWFGHEVRHQHRLVLRTNRATLMRRMGRFVEALPDLDYIVEADPHMAEYRVDRAIVQHGLGNDDAALADLTFAIEECVALPESYYNRAELRLARGEQEGALADLRAALRLDPDDHPTVLLYVETLLETGRFDDAVRVLDDQPDMAGDDRAIALRARIAVASGDIESALRVLDKAIGVAPVSSLLRTERCSVLYELGRYSDALVDLDVAIEQSEAESVLHVNRLKLLSECGRTTEAAEAAAVLLADEALPVELAEHVRESFPGVKPHGRSNASAW